MATSIYASTPETTNSNRASRILLGPCTDQLRDVLRHRVPPANFHHVLTRNRSNLPRLTQPQRDLIFPRSGRYSGDYSDMDISLLYLLLRNICNISPHTKGWGNTPDVSDSSLSASIDRIREARNGVVHSSSTVLTQIEFNLLLAEIKMAVIAMDSYLGNINHYEKAVDFLLTETMDPEQDVFIQQLKKQVEEEKITKEIVTKLEKQVHEDISTINEGVERLDTRVETLERGGERLESGVERLDRGVERLDRGLERLDIGVQKNKKDIEDIRRAVIEKQSVQDMSQQDVEENAQSEEVRGDEEILSQMFENPNCMKDLNDMIEKNVIKEKLSKQNSKDSPEGNTKIKLRLSTLPPAEDGSKMKEKILRRSFPHVLHKCLPNSIIEEIKKLRLPSQFRTKAMQELNKSENDDNLTKNRFLMTMLLREDTISEESTSCLMKNLVGSDILDYELKRNPGDIVGKIGENYGHILRELHGNIIMKMNEIYAVFGDEVFRSDSKSNLDRSALFLEDVLTKESKVLDLANMLSMLELDSLLHDKESEIGQDISQGKSHEKQDHEDEKDYSSRNKTVLEKKLAEAKEKFQTNNLMLARHSMNSDEVVFIGFDEKCAISEEVRAEFDGIKVYLRHPYYVDDEARRIAEFKGHNHGEISESREKLITSWILANSDRVWESHSNLRVLSSDCFKSTSTVITNKPCIVFYCRWKGFIPFQEVAFPSFVEYGKERIDVDVREGYFYLSPRQGEICSASPYQYNDPLCMGSCIGEKNKEKCGSLGLFVQWNRKRTSRKVNGFITCSHVLFECTHLAHFDYFQTEHDIKHVVQPATGCSPQETINSICGKVTVAHFHTNTPKSVDIAVVEVSERMPSTSGFIITLRSQIPDAGFNRETFPEYTNGRIIKEIPSNERRQPVVKSGTATGFTSGQFRLTATEVYIEKKGAELGDSSSTGKRIMKGQYEVYKTTPTPFSIPGDSGAAVFLYDTQKKLNCIGIVIGNTSGGSTVVTPIGNILECLGFDESNIVRFPPTTDEEV